MIRYILIISLFYNYLSISECSHAYKVRDRYFMSMMKCWEQKKSK